MQLSVINWIFFSISNFDFFFARQLRMTIIAYCISLKRIKKIWLCWKLWICANFCWNDFCFQKQMRIIFRAAEKFKRETSLYIRHLKCLTSLVELSNRGWRFNNHNYKRQSSFLVFRVNVEPKSLFIGRDFKLTQSWSWSWSWS